MESVEPACPVHVFLKGVTLHLGDLVTYAPSLVRPPVINPHLPRWPWEASPVHRIISTSGLWEGRALPVTQFASFYIMK